MRVICRKMVSTLCIVVCMHWRPSINIETKYCRYGPWCWYISIYWSPITGLVLPVLIAHPRQCAKAITRLCGRGIVLHPAILIETLKGTHYSSYYYSKSTDESNSLFTPAPIFAARTRYTMFTMANYPSFSSYSFGKEKAPLNEFLPNICRTDSKKDAFLTNIILTFASLASIDICLANPHKMHLFATHLPSFTTKSVNNLLPWVII